jgi:ribosomal protein S12 methylthiotransferase accessory factor
MRMDIRVTFPGGKHIDAQVGAHILRTDQPVAQGGEDSAPAPFDLFLASLGTCAGIYVAGFCQARGISTEGIELVQHNEFDPETHLLKNVAMELTLPAGFPEKYVPAVVRAAEGCKVKKTLATPPPVTIAAKIAAA